MAHQGGPGVLVLLVAAALALPAIAPLLGPGLIATHRYGDSPFLLVRLVALSEGLRAGTLFPRWSPELAYGLGYPFFNFYGALAYYLAAVPHLIGLPAVESIKLVQAAGFVAASLGAFLLARRHLGDAGGLVAAAAYGYAPYHLVNVYARGDSLGEFWALAILPALLLALEHAAVGSRVGTLLLPVLFAALILAHNLSALLGAPIVGLWAAASVTRLWYSSRRPPFAAVLCLGGGLALGAGLACFYWLPALWDRRYVHLEHVTTGYFDFRNHFLSLPRLIQPSLVYDYGLTGTVHGALPFQLGAIQVLLAGLGVVAAPLALRRHPVLTVLALSVTAAYVLLASSVARPVWEQVSTLQIAQFPWRALGPASLGTALLAALPAVVLRGRAHSVWAASAVLAAILAGSLGANPDRWPIPQGDITVEAVQRYEYMTSSIGSTVRYEYLPIEAKERPWTSSYAIEPEGPVLRSLPAEGATVQLLERRGAWFSLAVNAARAMPVVLEHHYFPGWRASLGGVGVALRASDPEGYLVVDVPAGDHRLEVWFDETRVRRAARLVSTASLALGVLSLVVLLAWRQRPLRPATTVPGPEPDARLVLVLGLVMVALLVVRAPAGELLSRVTDDGMDRRFADEHAPWPYVDARRGLAHRLPAQVGAGSTLEALVSAPDLPSLTARLVPPAEQIVGAPRATADPPTQVAPGGRVTLAIPSGTPPGWYWLEVGGDDTAGRSRDLLGPLLVRRGPPATPLAPPLANFGAELGLIEARPAPGASAARPSLLLRWRALRAPLADWRIAARLVDDFGNLWASADGRPADGFAPTGLWRVGDEIVEQRDLTGLPGLPPGRYSLEVRVYSLNGRTLDTLDVRGAAIAPFYRAGPFALSPGPAPSDPPPGAPPLELAEARLGKSEVSAGQSLPLMLLWRVGQSPRRDLRLIVTVGGLAREVPLAPGFPASAWRPGEQVRGQHAVPTPPELPPGDYAVRVSLVDESGAVHFGPRDIGQVRLENRARSFDVPAVRQAVGAAFGGTLELVGYDLEPAPLRPGGALGITLYWRARERVEKSYTVFVHLLDGDNRVRGQVDAVPGGGALPTDGWAKGEVVADRYEVPLDPAATPGTYALEVGLYDAVTGTRLPVGSSDHLVLTTVDARP